MRPFPLVEQAPESYSGIAVGQREEYHVMVDGDVKDVQSSLRTALRLLEWRLNLEPHHFDP